MELQFHKTLCPCLSTALRETRNLEQTQEIRLSDGMPDVGRILSAWGQVILRGKEWNPDSISLTAGMMAWVLYAPEDGSEPRSVECWIPIKIQWDLPEEAPDGRIRIQCLTRFVDARSLSARKILVRAGIGAMAEALTPMEAEIAVPEEVPEDVELLRTAYPLRLPREAGEKDFLLEDDLELPASAPAMGKILYYTLTPEVLEHRVLTDKIVFRGSGNLHILYTGGEGKLQSWDFSLPYSQYADLGAAYSGDADLDLVPAVTGLEVEQEGQHLHVKAGITAQYVVRDQQVLELIEDAYSPGRDLELHREELRLPAVLETREDRIGAEQTLAAEGDQAADVVFLPDHPRVRRTETGVHLDLPGTFQVLYYDTDGILQSVSSRWEGECSLPADAEAQVEARPIPSAPAPQILMGAGDMKVRGELPLSITTTSARGIPVVTGLELGQERPMDALRPSLILRRAGDQGLWDMAKASGSTVEAIRKANSLQQDPAPGQMLLIPIL